MSEWRVLKNGPGDAAFNMALDEELLRGVASVGAPILRLYSWSEPAASFGYFQHYADIAGWTTLRPLVRRPTGGGLVPHDTDWTYSIVIPPNDPWYELRAVESYRQLHQWIASVLRKIGMPADLAPVRNKDAPGQCFIGAEQHDILLNGKKIAGAAQRRTRDGLLIQGSVQPGEFFANRAAWEDAIIASIPATAWQPPDEQFARALELAKTKYSREEYNQRR
jgi:lipoate-protein ligase A